MCGSMQQKDQVVAHQWGRFPVLVYQTLPSMESYVLQLSKHMGRLYRQEIRSLYNQSNLLLRRSDSLAKSLQSIKESLVTNVAEERPAVEKESLEKVVMDCLRRFDKEHGSCSRSDLEEIVEILRDIQTTAHNLRYLV